MLTSQQVGADVQIWKCLGYNDNQKWIVDPVNVTAPAAPDAVNSTANATAEAGDKAEKRAHARRSHKLRRSGH